MLQPADVGRQTLHVIELRLDGERADSDLPPPALGEHTDEVLISLGVTGDEASRLKSGGVVA